MKGRWGVEENTVLCGSGQMGKGLGTAGGISGQGSLPSLSLAAPPAACGPSGMGARQLQEERTF